MMLRYIASCHDLKPKKAGILSGSDPDCQEMTHEFDQTLRLRLVMDVMVDFFRGKPILKNDSHRGSSEEVE